MSPSTILITFTALTANTIRSQPLCESNSGTENKSCCVPNCQPDCVHLCPETYFLLQNNSKMLCSKKGEIQENGLFNTPFSKEPFCTRTCPEGFHASNNESILLCIQCKTSCKVKKSVKLYNTTEKNTLPKESEMPKIAIVLSAVAATVCILMFAIFCFLNKKRICSACGQEQTRNQNRDASKTENGKKLEDIENTENPDAQGRNENGYVKDPTTGIQRENGTNNDAYDYAEERIVNRNAYKQTESINDGDESDGYEGYMENNGAASAATEQDMTDIYAKETFTVNHKQDNTSQQILLDPKERENSHEHQASSVEYNNFDNLENEQSYYVNTPPLNNSTDYENTKFNVITTEKVVAGHSNCVNAKTVNAMTAVNTNTINVNHAENVCIQNTTHVHFPDDNESKSKKIDKKAKTW